MCTTCKGLQKHLQIFDVEEESDAPNVVQWMNTTLPRLRVSSGSCRACALILQGILLHHERFTGVQEPNITVIAESFRSTPVQTVQDHLSVELRWRGVSNESCDGDAQQCEEAYPDMKLEFFTDGDCETSYSAIGKGRNITDAFLQESGLQTSRSMIGKCLAKHTICKHVKPHVKPATLPKRVLDVMIDDPSKAVKLHESEYDENEGHYEFGEYLALSYVSGLGKNVPQTTSKTLKAHQKGISWASLPRTFREAVLLTRSRGFRWLWIDALCIVQDDSVEKLTEALNMDEIFGNAFVTIAATLAIDTSRGLFPTRVKPFKIQATDIKGSLTQIYVREQPCHYSFKAPFNGTHMNDWETPFNYSKEAILHTPLMKRAWAYSERLLSSRVLHFTDSEMILECREEYQCECGRIDDSTYDSRTTDPVKQDFARIVAESLSNNEIVDGDVRRIDSVTSQLAAVSLVDFRQNISKNREEALQLWGYIVTEYTNRNLTYDADRLVAIGAVAKTLARPLGSGYVAGQWTCSTLGLLWYTREGAQCRRATQSPGIIVPSWSWASLEGSPIFVDNKSAMDLACNVDFSSPNSRDPVWSPVSGDKLKLTASMATEVNFRAESNSGYSLVRNGVGVKFKPDIDPPRGADAIDSGEKLVVILVSMTFRSSIIGLVLKRSELDSQLYRRVGRFECFECQVDGSEAEPEDAEALFEHWFPEIKDMTQLDDGPQRTFVVV
ncbi:HET-domain-containing protein [Massarina eburnea CBS 473.64]|uniref:HET-domain-containing protein n=1 Tax=Massarina eburnea CBS 473.64 TaxID=1395130 RepID=A0A6A6RT01_9PLEO|nr:HET-domain-containing protein [Massarina eburnea CBS 473.64]